MSINNIVSTAIQHICGNYMTRLRITFVTANLKRRKEISFYRSVILQRIYEEDPIAGRAIAERAMIIEEITSGRPRVDIEALAILPDETLPEIDRILLRQLPTLEKKLR